MKILRAAMPVCLAAASAIAGDLTNVPAANPKAPGMITSDVLSPELFQTSVATGAMKLENPTGVFTYYGYNNSPAGAAMVPTAPGSRVELNKTEPDKNVYLVLRGQKGADPNYRYGTHFLFQGHENGVSGYLTRINLDADDAHGVTLMGSADVNGAALPVYDGITWYPFSQRLLLTSEGSLGGGVWQATLDVPSKIESLTGIMGQGGYEGIQADPKGRLILVEDSGGASGAVNAQAKRPNSFVFRFIPKNTLDLTKGGVLQVLQAKSLHGGQPIIFDSTQTADQAILSMDVRDLHTYGNKFSFTWVTIHDTDVDGTAPFNANALAKTKGGTPFKRPENGQFRPGTNFREFYFDETGDTNAQTQAGADYGGFGGIFRLDLTSENGGFLSLLYKGDVVHTGLDNCSFLDQDRIVFVEDAGDGLHSQRNALDSAWLFDVTRNYAGGAQPIRILAEGRDPSATLDSLFSGSGFTGSFANEGDNEITGWHTSDGDATVNGLLGAKIPKAFRGGWRTFYTQQHGDNVTWEILSNDDYDDDDNYGFIHSKGRNNGNDN